MTTPIAPPAKRRRRQLLQIPDSGQSLRNGVLPDQAADVELARRRVGFSGQVRQRRLSMQSRIP